MTIDSEFDRPRNYPCILLSSGQFLSISQILLYPADLIYEIVRLKSEATKLLGQNVDSVSIGAVGQPSWELLGEVAVMSIFSSAIASSQNRSAKIEATKAIEKVNTLSTKLDSAGYYFDCSYLAGLKYPTPQAWYIEVEPTEESSIIDVSKMGGVELKDFLAQHDKSSSDVVYGRIEITNKLSKYIVNGSDFISIKSDSEFVSIRWSQVAAYYAPLQPPR